MTATAHPKVPAEALDAIEHLTDAADAFVQALRAAADQATRHPGYWAGYIAQIKHVAEHGAAGIDAALVVPLSQYGTDREEAARHRTRILSDAHLALAGAAEVVFDASAQFGHSDEKILQRARRRAS